MQYGECIKHGMWGCGAALGLALLWGLVGLGVSGIIG